ncbi:NAD(P)-dependent oxidoreductase [Nonomuraea diastatica]|uniref:Epimerase n=1 Tax=Nonomuraea diastatica TaxID=1848329 RepID=A0A4R4VM13_9ACTN|nr:NAD(P)H-binding protein [Nonomuraea diastatica]TDD06091.1 epimerase [Nonomuraea diastatica]
MRIVVLGATSRTGLCLLAEARRRGHHIVAFTRRPGTLADVPAPAEVVHNDGRDLDTVRAALACADAVISLLPGGGRRDPHLAAESARILTTAMADAGVRRLVVVSAYPIVGVRPRVAIWILRRVLATPYADVSQMERIVSACDLDWTIARLNRLVDRPATGAITISTGLLAKPRPHSRADSAATLLDLAEDPETARSALNISGS